MGRQAGFTIIEVTLFLAITGLLILGVAIGFNSTLSNNQHIDTTRSFESGIEAVYSTVRSGGVTHPVNSDGKASCKIQSTYPGASDECLVIGKLLYLENSSTIKVYDVVANMKPDTTCTETGLEALKCYHPTVLDMAKASDTLSPAWQSVVGEITFKNASTSAFDSLNVVAFLRHPMSELVYLAPFNDNAIPTSGAYELTGLDNNYANAKGQACLVHDGVPARRSYVRFNGGEGVGAIDTADDPIAGASAC